ncbi:MAG: hypothetical protein GY737_26750 [Desulfobacteraceae bacterium]|nr:hypothetical protein [Desulfobacteraceae bacterium]
MKAKSPSDLYKIFLSALSNAIKDGGHGTASYIAKNTGVSASLISQAINPDSPKKIGEENQIKIAEFLAGSYEKFLSIEEPLSIKPDLIKQKKRTTPTKHRSIKQTPIESSEETSVKMDEDIKMMLQRYDKMVESLELEKNNLRADLERERQEHKDAMAELREDYRDMKAEAKELRLENKQLLEQYRALKQKKAQSSQSPDKSEGKKAVNQ